MVEYLVGIGASAGGLDALERLFRNIPDQLGAAFVVIQHLSPDHRSMMAELLGRHTEMPVTMVESDCDLAPNNVYLISPGQVLRVRKQRIEVSMRPQHGAAQVIDSFFSSLANEYRERAIAVILSGTGSDGSIGAGRLREAGGLVLVQSPEDAKFDGMPRSVIGANAASEVLSAEEIGLRIASSLRNPQTVVPKTETASTEEEDDGGLQVDAAFMLLLELLQQNSGINFEEYKTGTIMRRIDKRMATYRFSSIQSYLRHLRTNPDELSALISDLTITVTKFFRDKEAFSALEANAIPEIVESSSGQRPIRVWCAGVATGEEAYSIVMAFLEAFDRMGRWPQLKLFATDVDQRALDVGSAGIYPLSIEDDVSEERLSRFFTRREDTYVVRPELRQRIVFARHDLLADPPFTKMDLVVCRNTIIYFRSPAQDRALRKLHYALKQGGYMLLGQSESLGDLQRSFSASSARGRLFRAEEAPARVLDIETRAFGARAGKDGGRTAGPPISAQQRQIELGRVALLEQFGPPPSLLVNGSREVVHIFGSAQKYLHFPDGTLSLQLDRVLAPQILPLATALLHRAVREKRMESSTPIVLTGADGTTGERIQLIALPVGDVRKDPLTLIIFLPVSDQINIQTDALVDPDTAASERVAALETELVGLRENLQMTIEELEASNEEMQATNEELMASNEELQSTNEELQSVNEELNTVNAEFVEKVESLNRSNAELDNLLQVASSSTIFLNDDLTILRYSDEALDLFRLRPSDMGRPISDIRSTLHYEELIEDLDKALDTQTAVQRHVIGGNNSLYRVRIKPYLISASKRKGVIVTFTDATPERTLAQYHQTVINSLGIPIALIDKQGDVTMVSKDWENAKEQDTLLRPIFDAFTLGDECLPVLKKAMASEETIDIAKSIFELVIPVISGKREAAQGRITHKVKDKDVRVLVSARASMMPERTVVLSLMNEQDWPGVA